MTKNVLIVDDNEPTRRLMAAIINEAGYETVTAENGELALKIIKEQDISCALIDQYMEAMDGFMLADHLSTAGYKIPMTMMTAHEGSDLLLQAQRHGFMSIIMKPVQPERLVQVVKRMCR
ncbi:MAG: response regulator [Alphaproteobacteria bacterium]|nr:response regulator [Alphaproteobacteria bacterium]